MSFKLRNILIARCKEASIIHRLLNNNKVTLAACELKEINQCIKIMTHKRRLKEEYWLAFNMYVFLCMHAKKLSTCLA